MQYFTNNVTDIEQYQVLNEEAIKCIFYRNDYDKCIFQKPSWSISLLSISLLDLLRYNEIKKFV